MMSLLRDRFDGGRRWWHAWLFSLSILGCGYGAISPTAYSYAQALFSITNRQAVDQLDQVQQHIQVATNSQKLSAREANWLSQIIDQARAGNWKGANRAARNMLEDQIRREPKPPRT